MAEKKTKVNIRHMEPEDIAGILAIDREISGQQRALTYRDLVRDYLGGEFDFSFVAEIFLRMIPSSQILHSYVKFRT
jgi:hypothetical protein